MSGALFFFLFFWGFGSWGWGLGLDLGVGISPKLGVRSAERFFFNPPRGGGGAWIEMGRGEVEDGSKGGSG